MIICALAIGTGSSSNIILNCSLVRLEVYIYGKALS